MKQLTEKQKQTIIDKVKIQLDGVSEAFKIYNDIINKGFVNLEKLQIKEYKSTIGDLNNFYIKNIVLEFKELITYIDKKEEQETLNKLVYIYALLKKAQTYLEEKIQNPELEQSDVEMLIQNTYTINSLKKSGFVKEEANITLLCDIKDKRRKINEIWIDLGDNNLYYTQNISKLLEEYNLDNNVEEFLPYLKIGQLGIYDKENIKRVVFKEFQVNKIEEKQLSQVISSSYASYDNFEKDLKDYFKKPLNTYGFFLVQVANIYESENGYIIENKNKENIEILDNKEPGNIVAKENFENAAVLLDIQKSNNNLHFQIRSIIKEDNIYSLR